MNAIHARAKLPDGSSAANVRISALPMSVAQEVFRSGYLHLVDEIARVLWAERATTYSQRRVGELKCTTIYNDLKKL